MLKSLVKTSLSAGLYEPTYLGLNEASIDFEVWKVVIVYDLGKMLNFSLLKNLCR